MPENPHNSIEQLRRGMGLGVFSDRPLFLGGEVDEDARQAYFQRANDTFSKSSEAQRVVERYGKLGWFQSLLDFGLNYLGESVDKMTPESLQEFVFDYVPRKVSVEAEAAAAIIGELTLFWQYLDRVYKLPAAKAVVAWLQTDGLVARLEADLSDPENFGMAKSMFMLGQRSGYDMTSSGGLATFMADYNQSLLTNKASATRSVPNRAVSNRRVGRNDPCPCGSGKKYKKCCGGSQQRG